MLKSVDISMSDEIFIILKSKRFQSLPFDEKKRILNAGRPMPELNISKEKTRKFHEKGYEDVMWLSGNGKEGMCQCYIT